MIIDLHSSPFGNPTQLQISLWPYLTFEGDPTFMTKFLEMFLLELVRLLGLHGPKS